MVLSNVLFYLIISELAIEALQLKNLRDKYILRIIVFLFIALDPIVFGYFHSLLTEFDAAIFVSLSALLAIKLIKEPPFRKVLVSHLLFHGVSCYGMVLKTALCRFSTVPAGYKFVHNSLSKYTWKSFYIFWNWFSSDCDCASGAALMDKFLDFRRQSCRQERQFSTWLSTSVENKQTEIAESSFIKTTAKNYLISINLLPYLGKGGQTNTKDISLVSGYQNVVIAQRIYNTGLSTHFTADSFNQGVPFPSEVYNQPLWLNRIFQSRSTFSNFLFTVTGLLLPFACIICIINWIRKKDYFNSVLLIMLGSSALNAFAHNISGAGPIDRYLFLGYPLHLLSILLIIYHLLKRAGLNTMIHAGKLTNGQDERVS